MNSTKLSWFVGLGDNRQWRCLEGSDELLNLLLRARSEVSAFVEFLGLDVMIGSREFIQGGAVRRGVCAVGCLDTGIESESTSGNR
jgi:hypothetical protein